MKRKRLLYLAVTVAALSLFSGCARFQTVQIDKRDGQTTTVTTKATAWTFWESQSQLARWTAKQSESEQGAEVGGLNQSSQVTSNTVAIVEAVVKGVVQGLGKAAVPVP